MSRPVAAAVVGAVVIALAAMGRLFVWPAVDTVDHVDAIVVLGGGEHVRLQTGLDLFAEGAGDVLVLSAGTAEEATTHGLDCDDSTVVCVDPTPVTTAGEARTISELAAYRGWASLAVVTSTYHLSRARALFGQCFDGRLAMVEAPVSRDRMGLARDAVREVPALIAGLTFARAC